MRNPNPPNGDDINIYSRGKLIGTIKSTHIKKEPSKIEFRNGNVIHIGDLDPSQNLRGKSIFAWIDEIEDEEGEETKNE